MICKHSIMLWQYTPKFMVSRWKTLQKRRRITIKKRPLSAKRLKQESKHMNFAREYRALQIKKQLDKRSYPNQHIDELMQQIFYPDIAYANQQALSITFETQKQNKTENFKAKTDLNQNMPEKDMIDESDQSNISMLINEKIGELILPEDLLKLYEQCMSPDEQGQTLQFSRQNYMVLFQKFGQYFSSRQYLKKKLVRDWDYRMSKMKKKNKQFVVKPCPYIFYDRDDIYWYPPWQNLLINFAKSIQNSQTQESNQEKVQSYFQYLKISASMYRYLGSIPSQIYECLVNKTIEIFPQIEGTLQQNSFILYFINLRKKQKYSEHHKISIDEKKQKQQQKIATICQTICLKIVADPQCSIKQLEVVMKTFTHSKDKMVEFNEEQAQAAKKVITTYLSQLKVEKVIEYLSLYLKNCKSEDRQFLQLLKYDIYRKLPTAQSKNHLLLCLSLIKSGKFIANEQTKALKINEEGIEAMDLFHQTAQTLSAKFCGTGALTSDNARIIVWHYFINRMRDQSLLQLIANQLVKNKSQITLEKMTESVFQLNILGFRSAILAEVLFQEYLSRYSDAKKRYKENHRLLLPSDEETNNKSAAISQQQKNLEQSLVIAIWMMLSNIKQHNSSVGNNSKSLIKVNPDTLLKIYPTKISSNHTLIIQLCKNIYELVKPYKLFSQIQYKRLSVADIEALKQSKDIYRKYYNTSRDVVSAALFSEARESGQFIYNFNHQENFYLKEPWSSVSIHNQEFYIKWVLQNRANAQIHKYNYFNPKNQITMELSNLRRKVCLEADQKAARGEKLYAHITEEKDTEYYNLN